MYSKLSFGEVYHQLYGCTFHFIVTKMKFATIKKNNFPPQMTVCGTFIPILMHSFTFSSFKVYYITLKANTFCKVKTDISQREAMIHNDIRISGRGCSQLMTWLVNMLLKFQTISQICQYFLLKKCVKLLSFFFFFNKKFQCIWL